MSITTEWTEACRSGCCTACDVRNDLADEVITVDIGTQHKLTFRLCPECACDLVIQLFEKLGKSTVKCL